MSGYINNQISKWFENNYYTIIEVTFRTTSAEEYFPILIQNFWNPSRYFVSNDNNANASETYP